MCHCGNMGRWNRHRIRAHKVLEKKNCLATPAGIQTHHLSVRSLVLYQQAVPALLKSLHTPSWISGSALLWLRSYILNRSQVIVVNSISSTPKWGPTRISVRTSLFVLYTQPTLHMVRQCSCDHHKFLDDIQLFSSAPFADFGILIKPDRAVCLACQGLDWFQQTQT